ncbi:MAG: NERD domain-containing protein [Anaerolineales bacterium]|nr:NERD domain-containing protein [Anaerolineales bacterium]
MSKQTRSPLTAKPLRNPGQSLDEQIQDLLGDAISYMIAPLVFLALAIVQWEAYLTRRPPNPWLGTVLTVALVVYSGIKLYKLRQEVVRLRMARDGEKAVGQYLQDLEEVRVFHDVLGPGFNVDHVVISRKGIYAIDTKTYSKPLKGEVRIRIADDRVYANGHEIERNPLNQIRALTSWVQQMLKESTGKTFPVRGVVLFPGWFVEPFKEDPAVWVLNPKAFPKYLKNDPERLAKEDVHLAVYHLSRFIRGGQ